MRISHWSSDVCSSDLLDVQRVKTAIDLRQMIGFAPSDSEVLGDRYEIIGMLVLYLAQITGRLQEVVADHVDNCLRPSGQFGTASGRERVMRDVYITVVAGT